MNKLLFCVVFSFLFVGCQSFVDVPPVTSNGTTSFFRSADIRHVIFRARKAKSARITTSHSATIKITATPEGGTKGYYPSDPDWKETPARDWGLKFVGRQYGDTLVISSENEIYYIHHDYYFSDIRITVPSDVTLKLQERLMDGDDGDGKPDLRR